MVFLLLLLFSFGTGTVTATFYVTQGLGHKLIVILLYFCYVEMEIDVIWDFR